MRKNIVTWFILLIGTFTLQATASTQANNPEVRRILALREKAKTQELTAEVIADLKDVVSDESRHRGQRVLAIGVLGDIALDLEEWDLETYFYHVMTDYDPQLAFGGQAFLQIARIQVHRAPSADAQIARLVDFLDANLQQLPATYTRLWAAEELCSRGYEGALVKVEEAFRGHRRQDVAKNMAVCTSQISYVNNTPSRLKALAAALHTNHDEPEVTALLHDWAIRELGIIEDAAAGNVLRDYAIELQSQFSNANSVSEAIAATQALLQRGWSPERLEQEGIALHVILEAGGIPEWAKAKSGPTKNQAVPDESPP